MKRPSVPGVLVQAFAPARNPHAAGDPLAGLWRLAYVAASSRAAGGTG